MLECVCLCTVLSRDVLVYLEHCLSVNKFPRSKSFIHWASNLATDGPLGDRLIVRAMEKTHIQCRTWAHGRHAQMQLECSHKRGKNQSRSPRNRIFWPRRIRPSCRRCRRRLPWHRFRITQFSSGLGAHREDASQQHFVNELLLLLFERVIQRVVLQEMLNGNAGTNFKIYVRHRSSFHIPMLYLVCIFVCSIGPNHLNGVCGNVENGARSHFALVACEAVPHLRPASPNSHSHTLVIGFLSLSLSLSHNFSICSGSCLTILLLFFFSFRCKDERFFSI